MEQLGYFSKNSLQHPPTEVAKVTKSEKGIAWWGGGGGGRWIRCLGMRALGSAYEAAKARALGASEPAASIQSAWRDWCVKNWFPLEENLTDGRPFRLQAARGSGSH